jgi:hypothetical protein
VRISEKAPAKVNTDIDAEWAKAEATQNEYLDKMDAHTALAKHSLGLDKMLGEKKVELDGRERDLSLYEEALVEAQSQGPNPWDNRDELMEFIELQKLLKDAEVGCITKAKWLEILARDVSKVLVDLGVPPIPRIPRDPRTASNILQAMGAILECLQEAYATGHDPLGLGIVHLPPSPKSVILNLFFIFIILFIASKIFQGLTISGISTPSYMSPPSLAWQGIGSLMGSVLPNLPSPGSHTEATRGPKT